MKFSLPVHHMPCQREGRRYIARCGAFSQRGHQSVSKLDEIQPNAALRGVFARRLIGALGRRQGRSRVRPLLAGKSGVRADPAAQFSLI